jgi:hypothetical protein
MIIFQEDYPEIKDAKRSTEFQLEVVDYPAHSPELASRDFHLFLHLKKHLADQKFHEDEEAKNEDTTWLRAQLAEFCDFGTQNLAPRLNKCLDKGDDYVEKQLKACVNFFHSILLINTVIIFYCVCISTFWPSYTFSVVILRL